MKTEICRRKKTQNHNYIIYNKLDAISLSEKHCERQKKARPKPINRPLLNDYICRT